MLRLSRLVVALVTLLALWPAFALAQTKAGVVTTLQGSATAARTALPQPVALKFKDDVFQNDRIVTGDQSIVRMLLGGKAVVTVRERSSLTITEVPGKSTIDLDVGKIAVAVAKEKMRPGESIEVKTPNAVAAVRGTAFVIEVIRATAAADAAQAGVTTNAYWFRGVGTLTIANQIFNMVAGAFFTGTGNQGVTGTMTPQQQQSALSGLSPNAENASGGQAGAKDQALGATVASFNQPGGGVLPAVAAEPTPAAPTPVVQAPINSIGQDGVGGGGSGGGGGSRGKPSGGPTGILVFGDRAIGSTVQSALDGLGHTVTMTASTLPNDLSAFGTIWHVSAFTAFTAAEQTRLKDFLALGRGLHLTGEHQAGCCSLLNASVQSFLRLVVSGGSGITTADDHGFGVVSGPYPFNASARGNVATTPNALSTWSPAAPGGIGGIAGANVLVTGVGGIAVGGVWGFNEEGRSDLVTETGRLTLLMDSDWIFGSGGQERVPVIENIQTFIDDPPTRLTLTGPLFRSANEQFDSSSFLSLSGYAVTSTTEDPLLWLTGTRVTASIDFLRMIDSSMTTGGSLIRLENGSEIIQTSAGAPLVAISGGLLSVGNGSAGGHLLELYGRPGATRVDPETGLTLGTDRPLQPGAESPVFDASHATVTVRGSAYRVDTALLDATAPLLNLTNNTTFTTSGHAVDLAGRAKVSIPNDAVAMVNLNSSLMTVTNGHLVNVAGGSYLNLAGSLLNLSNGSTLNILNGLLLNVTGGSVANIGKSLISFNGSGNLLNVTNNLVPSALIGGIPVYGPADSFRISGNALAGLGTAGTIKINGMLLTPTTPLAAIKGSLVAVQGNGAVKVGP